MNDPIGRTAAERNETILARVEELGGGYVWDAEVFAVTLMDVAIDTADAVPLAGLVGVQQIALDCSRVAISELHRIALIPLLQSLVLCNSTFSASDLEALRRIGPDVDVVSE